MEQKNRGRRSKGGRLRKGVHSAMGFGRYKTPQEMEKISEAFYYDVIVSSAEIKKLILHRIEFLEVDLDLVLKEAGITKNAFRTKYLEQKDPVSTPKLRQSHIESLLNVLGVEIKIQCVVERDSSKIRTEHLKRKK